MNPITPARASVQWVRIMKLASYKRKRRVDVTPEHGGGTVMLWDEGT